MKKTQRVNKENINIVKMSQNYVDISLYEVVVQVVLEMLLKVMHTVA